MWEKKEKIKVVVVNQSVTLNGVTTKFTDLPIGTVIDAVPEFYKKTIMNYIVEETIYDQYSSYPCHKRYPLEIFKPLSKLRDEKIDSIFED